MSEEIKDLIRMNFMNICYLHFLTTIQITRPFDEKTKKDTVTWLDDIFESAKVLIQKYEPGKEKAEFEKITRHIEELTQKAKMTI